MKNPNYWGEEPDVDRFTVKVIPESKVAAMRAGEVDFIMGSDTLDANSYLELSQVEGITGVISDFDFVTEFIALNDEVAPLDDLNVRTAIQMAIDKESIAQNIYSGLRTKADSVMPADMPYCTATAVSYTHLDVYKRQLLWSTSFSWTGAWRWSRSSPSPLGCFVTWPR